MNGRSAAARVAHFGARVFHRSLIQELPRGVAQNWLDVLEGDAKFDPVHADVIAEALKNWALQHGATHFSHWFQPLTNGGAKQHDSFLSFGSHGAVIQQFRGKELLRCEPGHEARGYTVWDPKALPFLWEEGGGMTLCIPALFFSWKGAPLDHKIPLLRSEEKLGRAALRLLRMCGVAAHKVFPILGVAQGCFVIDRNLFLLRSDLVLAGRTVFGARPPKGEELEDRHSGAVKEQVMAYMGDVEEAALRLSIPVKTWHKEAALAQYEVAPLFERASVAVDHNLLLMELMRGLAWKRDLVCLLHDKPFMGISGSGQHNHWSLSTDGGQNLLDPRGNNLVFFTLLSAILRAVHEHAELLYASIGSVGSVYLGEALEKIIEEIIHEKKGGTELRSMDLGPLATPRQDVGLSRNRTPCFAFTGRQFEFRAVGGSAHSPLPVTVMNAIVADSLQLILDEIAGAVGDGALEGEALFFRALPVLRKHLRGAKNMIFGGNHDSGQIQKSFDPFSSLIDPKTIPVFSDVLSPEELHSRYEIFVEQYVKTVQIELHLMIELFQTQILPAAQKDMLLRGIQEPLIEEAVRTAAELNRLQSQTEDLGWEGKGKVCAELIGPKMDELRSIVDRLEGVVDSALWPLPKYRELLYL
ncbi:MAG: glutamine synthetase III [Chlamydiales bacterium]